MTMPNFKDPGATALRGLLDALAAQNAAIANNAADVDEAVALSFLEATHTAADNFRRKAVDIKNFQLRTAKGREYQRGAVVPREKAVVQFDYLDNGNYKTYTSR